MHLVQIVPNIPNSLCGVGDNASALGSGLDLQHAIPSTYLVVNRSDAISEPAPSVVFLKDRSAKALADGTPIM